MDSNIYKNEHYSQIVKIVEDIKMELLWANFCQGILKKWRYSNYKDECRPPNANSKTGGLDLLSKETTNLIRSTGWEVIKQIGKKIINGEFNLTTVSFPIKVMLPFTILQSIARSLCYYPVYLNIASMQDSPLEKMKFAIVASLSCFHKTSTFLKPMNPIIGETYTMVWGDGSRIFLEQTSHHPPVSNYIMYGPNNNYKYYGYSCFASSAGLNSLKVVNKGKRVIEFKDKTKISLDFVNDTYSNSFWGTLRHESLGEINYYDETNGYHCLIKLGSVKKKPSDYFTGEIKFKNEIICKVYGSYLSFIEFDQVRYWDIREDIDLDIYEYKKPLPSCSCLREDRIFLQENDLAQGQAAKERLEILQRKDRKLREQNEKSN